MRAGVTSQRAALTLALFLLGGAALAHGVAQGDRGFVQGTIGAHPAAFIYLGAKHMVTGYDHLLYLAGVIFYLRSTKRGESRRVLRTTFEMNKKEERHD